MSCFNYNSETRYYSTLKIGENKKELMYKFNIKFSIIYDINSLKEMLMAFAFTAETSKAMDERKTPQYEKLDKSLYQ